MTTGLEAHVVVDLGHFTLDASIAVARGTTVAVVGPNGAGKSTLLRALAGIEPVTAGSVRVDGTDVTDLEPERRPIGVVFQELRLFPHLTALDNVAFGLRARGTAKAAARAEAGAWLERLGVGAQSGQRPSTLSGGQAQRVALARTLATEPPVLLLDEPLSALDATTRVATRRDLRRHLDGSASARLVVTHDPLDALALADALVVLERGRVVQQGTLAELAAAPRSAYVADLVGVNRFEGTGAGSVIALDGGVDVTVTGRWEGPVIVVIHPRAVALHGTRPEGSPRNVWQATVVSVEAGLDETARVAVEGPLPLVVEITSGAARELALAPGRPVWASIKATEVRVSRA